MQMKDKKGNEKEKESLPSDLIPTGIQNKTKQKLTLAAFKCCKQRH
jgi:hypothetical protein